MRGEGRRVRRRCLLPLALLAAAPGSDFIWLEGESPATLTGPLQSAGWGREQDLSGRKWLFAAVDAGEVATKIPEDGLTARYEFEAAGRHEVWVFPQSR